MRPSALLLTASVGLGAAADTAVSDKITLEEYRGYLKQARFTTPGPDDRLVYFRRPLTISWELPPNNTFPRNTTRFDNVDVVANLYLSYEYRNDDDVEPEPEGQDGSPSIVSVLHENLLFSQTGGEVGGEWPLFFSSGMTDKPSETVGQALMNKLLDALRDRSGWDSLGDLRGGERFSFRVEICPFIGAVPDKDTISYETIESTLFDVEQVEGYTPGQQGAEWKSDAAALARPAALAFAGVAALAALML